MARTAVLARVAGRVQGVGFRWWTRDEATALGLDGWVRNERDGSVVALLAGPETAVVEMLARLRQGPSGAAVAGVTTEPADPADAAGTFRILR